MYDSLKTLLEQLAEMRIKPFIGYGNPDARILIIGKECASTEGSKDWELFFKHNYDQWKASFEGRGFGYSMGKEGFPYEFENGFFHPLFPFYPQENNRGKTSSTYYWYQRLIQKIRATDSNEQKSPIIDFFQDCFITELSEECRPNNSTNTKAEHQKTKDSIRQRFDWMRQTYFFRHFDIVILACGPYANAIKKDNLLKEELFGNAHVIFCNQLSRWDTRLDEEITAIQNILQHQSH